MTNTLPLIGYTHRLSPTYVLNRSMRWLYHSQNQSKPWMNRGAVGRLESLVNSDDLVWEWGSGRSTQWLARNCRKLYSVEDSREWYEKVKGDIQRDGHANVTLIQAVIGNGYASSILGHVEDGSADIVIVDGKERDLCAMNAVIKVKPGGVMLIDDAQRYLPGCPQKCQGRMISAASMTPAWELFSRMVTGWKREWFTDGVTASLFLHRPV
jgi:hypothetical protein